MNLKQNSSNNMSHNDYVILKRNELIELATLILKDEINVIEAIRKICNLRFQIDDPENEFFLPFIAIDSDTDHYPVGNMRANCDEGYLKSMDIEMAGFLKKERQYIVNACLDIIKACSYN